MESDRNFACFMLCFVRVVTDSSHITQLGGVKHKMQDLKSELAPLINQVTISINDKFSEIYL